VTGAAEHTRQEDPMVPNGAGVPVVPDPVAANGDDAASGGPNRTGGVSVSVGDGHKGSSGDGDEGTGEGSQSQGSRGGKAARGTRGGRGGNGRGRGRGGNGRGRGRGASTAGSGPEAEPNPANVHSDSVDTE
jgi:hypothetical protein